MTRPVLTAALIIAAILAYALTSAFAGATTTANQPGLYPSNPYPAPFQQVTYGDNCVNPLDSGCPR